MKKLFLLCLLIGSITPQPNLAISYKKVARIGFETTAEIVLLSLCGMAAHFDYVQLTSKYDFRSWQNKAIGRTTLLLVALYATMQLGKKSQSVAQQIRA